MAARAAEGVAEFMQRDETKAAAAKLGERSAVFAAAAATVGDELRKTWGAYQEVYAAGVGEGRDGGDAGAAQEAEGEVERAKEEDGERVEEIAGVAAAREEAAEAEAAEAAEADEAVRAEEDEEGEEDGEGEGAEEWTSGPR